MFFDTEISPKSQEILDIGAIKENGDPFHSTQGYHLKDEGINFILYSKDSEEDTESKVILPDWILKDKVLIFYYNL